MTFQRSVNAFNAPGVEGDWASANPVASLLQPSNGDPATPSFHSWKVAPSGAIVGRFAFADTVTGLVSSANPGTGVVTTSAAVGRLRVGFVHRDQVSLITAYLGGNTMAVMPGAPITLLRAGDVWAEFAAGATSDQFVFASYVDGSALASNSSTPPTASIAVTTATGTPNLTAVGAGLAPGQPITGAGIPAGAFIVSVSGTTAVLSANATASAAISATVTTGAPTPYRVASPAAANDIAKISVQGI